MTGRRLPRLPWRDGARFPLGLCAGMAGAAAAMAAMWWLCTLTGTSIAIVPFTTSIVVIFGAPGSVLASSRSIVGGHLICSAVTLGLAGVFGYEAWVAAAALGIGTGAMIATRTFHPPAGINAMIIVVHGLDWDYLLAPVGVGAVLCALASAAFGRWPAATAAAGAARRRPAPETGEAVSPQH